LALADQPGAIPPQLLNKLEFAERNLRTIGYLSVLGGVFALVFMLLMAVRMGMAFLSMTYLGFLTGGAVAFALGLGLLSLSDAARTAGSMWFLAWGVLEVVLGFIAVTQTHDMPVGIFCLVGGVAQLVFADLLHLPAEVFLTSYCDGSITARAVEEGLMKAAAERDGRVTRFIAKYTGQPADEAEAANH